MNEAEKQQMIEGLDSNAPVPVLKTDKGFTLPYPAMYRIMVKVEPAPEKSEGGIIFVDSTKEREELECEVGVIVAVGRTAWWAYDDGKRAAEVGDKVMFTRYGGKMVDPRRIGGDKTYRILNDQDILAIWPQE